MGFQVLLYHEVRPEEELSQTTRPIQVNDGYEDALPVPLFQSLSHFKQQMTFLKEENYHLLTLEEVKNYYAGTFSLPEKSILLTFDDCYQSMKKYAYPILKELNFTAVSFVVTGWLYDTPAPFAPEVSRTLSFPELLEMSDVFQYANHTDHFHERRGTTLGKSMWEPEEDFVKDLAACNTWVKYQDVFAYPFGLYNEENVATLEKNHFTLGFTTLTGPNHQNTNPLELHRNVIPLNLPLEKFQHLVQEA